MPWGSSPVGSAYAGIGGSNIGTLLQEIMQTDDILPGATPSYQICKAIYLFHPLGGKMAEAPVKLAQSQDREIAIPDGPEEVLVEAFQEEWNKLDCSGVLLNFKTQSRVYGVASVGMLTGENEKPDKPVDWFTLYNETISFNVWDPLNTSGSLVTSQDPNSPYFQKHGAVVVNGKAYDRSRTRTTFNGPSVYIAWTSSGFGYVGRSCYQRGFYPLKTFLLTMVVDDLVALKSGLLIAKMKPPGTIISQPMRALFGGKRELLKEGRTGNVLTIGIEEAIESLNLMNIDGAFGMARNDCIINIATSDDMPAKILTNESYVEGFGEGTQDAYAVAQYIDQFRIEMQDDYKYFDNIVQHRAWNPEFYDTLVERGLVKNAAGYKEDFFKWRKSFTATWPSLIKEKPSEAAEVDEIKLKAVIAAVQVLAESVDPQTKAEIIDWAANQFNQREVLFSGIKLVIDPARVKDWLVEQDKKQDVAGQQKNELRPPPPFSNRDSAAPNFNKIVNLVDKVNTIADGMHRG